MTRHKRIVEVIASKPKHPFSAPKVHQRYYMNKSQKLCTKIAASDNLLLGLATQKGPGQASHAQDLRHPIFDHHRDDDDQQRDLHIVSTNSIILARMKTAYPDEEQLSIAAQLLDLHCMGISDLLLLLLRQPVWADVHSPDHGRALCLVEECLACLVK